MKTALNLLIGLLLIMVGILAGLATPDVDQQLSFLQHRSLNPKYLFKKAQSS